MKWKASIERAVHELRAEEKRLARELGEVTDRIASLARLAGSKAVQAKKATRKMSAKGRAAIARAAKKRWAKYRAAKKAS